MRIYDTYAGSCAKLLRLHHGSVSALQHVRHGDLDVLVRCAAAMFVPEPLIKSLLHVPWALVVLRVLLMRKCGKERDQPG